MKFWRRVLILLLIIGGIWGIWGIWRKVNKKEISGQTAQGIPEKPLKFAVMSDVHSDWDNFRIALQKAKEGFGPASAEASARQGFVIITGDLTTIGKKSELLEAKKILDQSGLVYYLVPGNHDIWWGRKFKQNLWKEVFGNNFLAFKKENVKFILINNGDGEGGFEGFGNLGQKAWLKEEAKECLKIFCLVFVHMPLNHPSSLHVMGEDNPPVASEAAEIRSLLVANQAHTIFAGHLHFSSSYELEGLKTTIVGAVTAERNFQSPKFVEVTITGRTLSEKDIFLTD